MIVLTIYYNCISMQLVQLTPTAVRMILSMDPASHVQKTQLSLKKHLQYVNVCQDPLETQKA